MLKSNVAETKTLPHNIAAEQSVLACLMLDYVGCSGGIDKLAAADFFSPAHQTIFEAMQKLAEKKGKTIDFVTVAEALTGMGKLDSVGGVKYLNTINDTVPSVASFRQYFDIVKKNSTLRKLVAAGKEIYTTSFAAEDEQDTLSAAEKLIFDISKAEERKELTSIGAELPVVMNRLDDIKNDPTKIFGIKTGFYGIDNLTNGLHGGELVILAARPGVGKTSLGLNMILNAALYAGKKCAVFSLEMSKAQLTTRALCSLAMVSSYKAGRGELDEDEWGRLWTANEALSNAGVYIDDNSDITATEIRRKCMRLKRESGLDFVMVDYLGLMNPGNVKRDNRQVEVAANSRAMKILAKELDVPVLLLAQLNRNIETRTKKGDDAKPALHDLRESGAIEQDADVVMFIHMERQPTRDDDEDDDDEAKTNTAEIILAKHRNGPCGLVKLVWQREFTTFTNMPAAQSAQQERDHVAKRK